MKKINKILIFLFVVFVAFFTVTTKVYAISPTLIVDYGTTGVTENNKINYAVSPSTSNNNVFDIIDSYYSTLSYGIFKSNSSNGVLFMNYYYILYDTELIYPYANYPCVFAPINYGVTSQALGELIIDNKSFAIIFCNYIKQLSLIYGNENNTILFLASDGMYQITFKNAQNGELTISLTDVIPNLPKFVTIKNSIIKYASIYQFNVNDTEKYNQGKQEGYSQGFDEGHNAGFHERDNEVNQLEQDKITYGESRYNQGVEDGKMVENTNQVLILGFFDNLLKYPARVITDGMNFSLLGINVGSLLLFIVSMILIIGIIMYVSKGRK